MDTVSTAISLVFVVAVTTLVRPLVRYLILKFKFRNIDGPRGLPFLGHIFQLGTDNVSSFKMICQWSEKFRDQGYFILYFGMTPVFVLSSPDAVEKALRDTKLDSKSYYYDFLRPWLHEGLLTSSGPKWATRRKLLTPSFHFTILTKFLDVFNEQAACFGEKLCGLADGKSVNIVPLVTLCTLDIICETIMGHKLGSQGGGSKAYVAALHGFGTIATKRTRAPWYRNRYIFNCSPLGREAARCLEVLHGLTRKVIRERQIELADWGGDDVIIDDQTQDVRKRRRLAFLDLLLEVQRRDGSLTDEGIQEEVDTSMFAGHDTVSTSIAFALYQIGKHPHVQDKVHEELDRVFGREKGTPVTKDNLAQLEYLSCVLKESQRLLTTVPIIGRRVEEESHASGVKMPPGVMILFNLFELHRDPKHFPDPQKFDPDRFLVANCEKRHNFAYVPFSAGHRNCIGQKFALMEQKVVLATVLRKLRVTSLQRMEDLRLCAEIVLRPVDGLDLKLEMRD